MKGTTMQIKSILEQQLADEIKTACKKSQRYVGYKAKRPLELMLVYGPIETVTQLVSRRYVNDAFVDLMLAGKTKLTLEYIVCKTKYRILFDDAVVKQAELKLAFN
jgi:hypothetical protein